MPEPELRCKIGHLQRKVAFPEVGGLVGADQFVGTLGCAPLHAERVELADVGGALAPRPRGAMRCRYEAKPCE